MLFHSYIFLFAFFPVTMLFWYGLNRFGFHRTAQIVLAVLSLLFYGYGHPSYIVLILCSVFVNWGTSGLMERLDERPGVRCKAYTAAGICGIGCNLGLLFYFKYFDFFIINLNRVLHTGFALQNIALPLGISFFTFQQISFLADRIMRKTTHYKMLDYINYVTFFPQLVAGPIVNHRDLTPQFQRIGTGEIDICKSEKIFPNLESGVRIFVLGMAKKVLLADKLGVIADAGYADVGALDTPAALLVMLCYTFQIYFDFSGYCDMAMGIARMLHIDLPRNFDAPYKSASVKEFWNRWHMTLNEFFTQYVYIPLGGGRCGMARKLCNIMIVFLLSGIWHGAAWTFVIWGLLHGMMMCLENIKWVERLPGKLRWFLTFSFINLAWVLFRSDSVGTAVRFYKRLFSFRNTGKLPELCENIAASWNYAGRLLVENRWGEAALPAYDMLLAVMLLLLAVFFCCKRETFVHVTDRKATFGGMCVLALLMTACVISLSGVTSFLYFNF